MSKPESSRSVRSDVPSLPEAQSLSHALLAPYGTRLDHVRTAGRVALGLRVLFGPSEHHLLVVAANLHDIGYTPQIAQTGFHPLDGGLHLRRLGYSPRLAALVAHHSHAHLLAPAPDAARLLETFPREESLLADALVYSDMHASPSGRLIEVELRLTDIERRHAHPLAAERTVELRASVRRVEAALARADHAAAAVSA